ncbi:restriction endonuclease [Treponema socranskii subsp. socranskii VPI DR56BR1116 = ATCC 35536]|uniref:Restriction endonuclease n=1 Tax=Treponema socranskii subsp. socranskii VPI DR56BR1116 = ATCC 35536 TaxID=1125725 RepID=A0ABP2YN05_TRESO|nr:tetratricopeptide repeat protein [Treponema socranskii]ERK00427.1 restriction endonuclease [Treponema socranskii subsp. socranskii VPI DR56BR1116 = ATCC 35536]
MEPIQIAVIAALIAFIAGLLLFLTKSVLAPKRAENILKLIKQKKLSAAEKLAKQILAKEPKNYLVHYYLGKAYLAENRAELALMEYKTVSENAVFGDDIAEVPFRKNLAALYLQCNQDENALREFLLLTKLEPENADAYYSAGKIYEKQNRTDTALTLFRKTVALDKRRAEAHASLALLLANAKQFAEAKKEIDLALSLNPEAYSNYYYLGKILKENKDYAGAVKAFEKAQRSTEYRERSLIERGISLMLAGRPDSALIDLSRAVELDKAGIKQETLHARYCMAACFEVLRQIDNAIAQWEIIYKKNHAFRDVAAKLAKYKDIQTNDALKDYLTCGNEDFTAMCAKLTQNALSFAVQRSDAAKWGCQIIATERDGDWMSVRKQLYLLRFYRFSDPLEDSVVRQALDDLKGTNCSRAYIFSSSDFSRSARTFAEGRPVELIGKEQLEQALKKSGV